MCVQPADTARPNWLAPRRPSRAQLTPTFPLSMCAEMPMFRSLSTPSALDSARQATENTADGRGAAAARAHTREAEASMMEARTAF